MSEERVYWNSAQLAEYWGVPSVTVRVANHRGKIPGVVKIAGHTAFDRDIALEGWIPKTVDQYRRKHHMPTLAVSEAKSAKQVADKYFNFLADHVPLERWLKIINMALDQAEEGDAKARKWLSDSLMGTPIQRVVADVIVDSVIPKDQLASVLETLLEVARLAREAQGQVIEGEAVDVTELSGTDADSA